MSRKKHRHRHRRRTLNPREVLHLSLHQNNISARNLEHIRELTRHSDADVKALAEVVLEIARVKPGRRRRMQVVVPRGELRQLLANHANVTRIRISLKTTNDLTANLR